MKSKSFMPTLASLYQQLADKHSNVVREILPTPPDPFYQKQHYPTGEIRDKVNHTQAYYHSHASHDPLRTSEHGHFHLFMRKALFEGETPIACSDKHLVNPKKEASTHVIAIGMNDFGFPTSLFTLNHWVIGGRWYSAESILDKLDRFVITHPDHTLTTQWLSAMMTTCRPIVRELLTRRDAVIAEHQAMHPDQDTLKMPTLEVTSLYAFQ